MSKINLKLEILPRSTKRGTMLDFTACRVLLVTNVWVFAVCRILRDPTVLQAFTIGPLLTRTFLGFPSPLYPTLTSFITDRLGLPELPQESFIT